MPETESPTWEETTSIPTWEDTTEAAAATPPTPEFTGSTPGSPFQPLTAPYSEYQQRVEPVSPLTGQKIPSTGGPSLNPLEPILSNVIPRYSPLPEQLVGPPSRAESIAGGTYNALAGLTESATSPAVLLSGGLAEAAPVLERPVAALWTLIMGKEIPKQIEQVSKVFKEDRPLNEKVEAAESLAASLAFIGAAGRHAITPERVAPLTSTEISKAQEQARVAGLPSQEPIRTEPTPTLKPGDIIPGTEAKAPEPPPKAPEPTPSPETAPPAPQPSAAVAGEGPREPWQMTREAFINKVRQQATASGGVDVNASYLAGENHKEYVREALEAGKPVRPEVLADYPNLKPTPPIPEQPVKAGEAPAPASEQKTVRQQAQEREGVTDQEVEWLRQIKAARDNWKRVGNGPIYPPLESIGLTKKQFNQLKRKELVEDRGFGPDVTMKGFNVSNDAFAESLRNLGRKPAAEAPIPEPAQAASAAPEPAISFPGIGSLREGEATTRKLTAIRDKEPQLWKRVTNYLGLSTDSKPSKVAQVAKQRFEEKRRSIGPGAASTEEFGPSESAMGGDSAAAAIKRKTIRIVEGIKQLWQRRANKEQITAQNEAADNNARITGRQAGSALRIGTDKLKRRAITFVMQSLKMSREGQPFEGDPAGYLRDGISRIRSTNKEATEAATYALYHFDELLPEAQRAHAKLDAQIDRERTAGLDTEYEAWYVPQRHELDLLPGPDRPVILGQSRGTGAGTGFRKAKTFPDYFTAIESGFVPKTLDIADLVEHRITTGERIVLRKRWADQFREVNDPVDGKPVVTDIERRVIHRPDGTVDVQYSAPLGYSLYEPVPGTRIAVHDGYKRLFNALTGRSQIAESALGSAALSTTAALKSGLLLLDTFHVSRVGQSELALSGRLGYKKGLSLLEYADTDLDRAAEAGLITPEMADYARNNRPIAKLLIDQGLNVGRVHQQMYTDWLKYLPPIEATNKWIFEKMTRGAMLESAMLEFQRISRNHPEWSESRVARQVAKDINTFYSNLGKQGLIKNPALRDLLQITMLAPWWVEGLAMREVKSIYQTAGALKDLATTGRLNVPTVAKGVMTGIAAYVVATQMLNLFTRGHLTFQNEEEGHKLDAWIPDFTGKTKGYFISPLSVFGEITHDFLRYGESKPTFADAAAQIGYNKLSPVGRSVAIGLTGRDVFGNKLPTTASRALEAGGALLPVPIPLAGFTSQRPGSVQRQLTSGVGLKTEYAPTARQQINALHQKWLANNPDPKVKADYERHLSDQLAPPAYKNVYSALNAKDGKALVKAVSDLQAQGTKLSDIRKQLQPRKEDGTQKHLLQGTVRLERQFRDSLSPVQYKLYQDALREREEQYRFFNRYF